MSGTDEPTREQEARLQYIADMRERVRFEQTTVALHTPSVRAALLAMNPNCFISVDQGKHKLYVSDNDGHRLLVGELDKLDDFTVELSTERLKLGVKQYNARRVGKNETDLPD